MSKKHFQALADALKTCRAQFSGDPQSVNQALVGWRVTVQSVANVRAQTNPRFDRARFLRACGMED